MPKGVITKVWQKKGNGPGSVVFSDGEKYATFSDATLTLANTLIGQLVSYTLEENGKYTNLGKITPMGGGSQGNQGGERSLGRDEAPARAAGPIDLEMRKQVTRIADAVEAVVAFLKSTAPVSISEVAREPREPAEVTDPITKMLARLAQEAGDASTEAMFTALKKKHKTPEKLKAAVIQLLADHNITVDENGEDA